MDSRKTAHELRLEPGAAGYYRLGAVVALVMLAVSGWLLASGEWLLGLLGGLVFLDVLLAVWRSRRWAVPLELRGDKICRAGDCRWLGELRGARFVLANAARVVSMREGQLLLEWPDGAWRVPLGLCGWEKLWEAVREARPDLELGDWQEDPAVRRVLAFAWDAPLCPPPGAKTGQLDLAALNRMLLVVAVVAVLVGLAAGAAAAYGVHTGWLGEVLVGVTAALLARRWLLRSAGGGK